MSSNTDEELYKCIDTVNNTVNVNFVSGSGTHQDKNGTDTDQMIYETIDTDVNAVRVE